MSDAAPALARIAEEVIACRACPCLVEWRESVGALRRAAFSDETYWARPLPGFGDPDAALVIVGLAPAAHGGNRTGRVFTGDRSGDFLFAALHRAHYANQAESIGRDDGLRLADVFITAAVRCAPPDNKPTPFERDACRHFFVDELAALQRAKVILALGAFAYDVVARTVLANDRRRPRFAHGLEIELDGNQTLLCSYHPSQRNVFTGLLTVEMFDAVLRRAGELAR